MNKGDLKGLYGQASAPFRACVEHALTNLKEEENMKKRYKASIVLAAAAVIVIMAGTALALGSGLLEDLNKNHLRPLPGAEDMLVTNLGSMETDLFTLTIEEAVYDGYSAAMYLRVTPKDPENYAITCSNRSAEAITQSGRKPIDLAIMDWYPDSRPWNCSSDCTLTEDGGFTQNIVGIYDVRQPEEITIPFLIRWDVEGDDTRNEAEMSIRLTRSGGVQEGKLVPENDGVFNEHVRLISGTIAMSPLYGYYTLEAECADKWIYWYMTGQLYDEAGNPLTHAYPFTVDEDVNRICRAHMSMEMQAIEQLPETVYLELRQSDKIVIGRIKCAVEPVK